MSGRLVILPKKSYCPWKPENVERVRRDERLASERRERQVKADRQKANEIRMKALKKGEGDSAQEKHVNLFQVEEEAANRGFVHGGKKVTRRAPVLLLGQTELRSRAGNAPFYLRRLGDVSDKMNNSEEPFERKDRKLKTRLDPMQKFDHRGSQTIKECQTIRKDVEENSFSDESSGNSRRRRKRKKKSRQKQSSRRVKKRRKAGSSAEALAEMRQRREERELKESQRAAALVRNSNVGHVRYNNFVQGLTVYNAGRNQTKG